MNITPVYCFLWIQKKKDIPKDSTFNLPIFIYKCTCMYCMGVFK